MSCITDTGGGSGGSRIETTANVAREIASRGIGKPSFRLKSVSSSEWDIAGQCRRPVTILLRGRPTAPVTITGNHPVIARGLKIGERVVPSGIPMHTELRVRCRSCERCGMYRRAQWMERTIDEILAASRVWFVTLTFSPRAHLGIESAARLRFLDEEPRDHVNPDTGEVRRLTWFDLSERERFRRRAREAYPEVQKFLKRVRKGGHYYRDTKTDAGHVRKQYSVPPTRLRYQVVAEKHSDKLAGRPHFHLLLFEQGQELPKAFLEQEWKLGVFHARLVDRESDPARKVAAYCCKYLTKDPDSLIRASQIARSGSSGRVQDGSAVAVWPDPPGPVGLAETFFPDERPTVRGPANRGNAAGGVRAEIDPRKRGEDENGTPHIPPPLISNNRRKE